MTLRLAATFVLILPAIATAQQITTPHASFLDIPARQAELKSTTNLLLRSAIKSLPSCADTKLILPPAGRMEIPHHYLSGSNGPTNPAEKAATELYNSFEKRITAGMNQYIATGSQSEAACSLAQLDAWAKANALIDYDPKDSSQAWFQAEWTLSAAGVTDSVLVNDPALDSAQQIRVATWLDHAARTLISFDKPGSDAGKNNHHYWRALAATSIGVTANDNTLFQFGIDAFKGAVDEINSAGALPKEMARHENAIHYQGFALTPLVLIAEFAARQRVDLYAYTANGHTLRDAIIFYGRAIDDPSLVKPFTSDEQGPTTNLNDFAAFNFFVARFGPTGIPPAILKGLQHSIGTTRIGGNTTVLAAK